MSACMSDGVSEADRIWALSPGHAEHEKVGWLLLTIFTTTIYGAMCCMFGSPTPVTRFFTFHARYLFDLVGTISRDRLGAARVPAKTPALVAPWQMPQYRSPRTAPSRSKDMVHTSIAGAQHPAMISRTLIWHHSHYWEVPLRGRRWLQPTRHSSWRPMMLLW